MLKQASTACVRRHAVELAVAHIGELDPVADVAHVDAGAVEADAHVAAVDIELGVVERRQHHVVHGAARRHRRNERAHQQPRERRVAVGEMIDVGLVHLRIAGVGQAEPVEARIAGFARIAAGTASQPSAKKSSVRPWKQLATSSLHAADLDEIVAIARLLEELDLLLVALAGERVARSLVEREQLRLALRPRPGTAR